MNTKEKQIIEYLREGKSINISKIARELEIPISTMNDRIKKVDQKYITKRSSLLNYSKIGYNAHSVIAIKLLNNSKQQFLDFLVTQNCINTLYQINSGFNFLAEVVFKNNFELIKWTEFIQDNYSVKLLTFNVLKTEQKESFIPK